MLDPATIAVGVAVGLLAYEAIRSWAIDASWRIADWRSRRLRRKLERQMKERR